MAYPIDKKLVVGITSSALFDFTAEDEIFRTEGLAAFKKYQIDNRKKPPAPGAAFPFIKRLLGLNKKFPGQSPVEVVILSRNDPKAGSRITDAIPEYGLDISRSFFLSGQSPYPYMKAINACLYLSANKEEVKSAVAEGHPAGYVLPCAASDDSLDTQLRIAFDFDGILVDDEAEKQYAKGGIDLFRHHEITNSARPLKNGPLMPLLQKISAIQDVERNNPQRVNDPDKAIRVAIVTARNAPAHDRMMNTLEHHGIEVDELFLTGGIEKKNILDILRPQIFFDDQLGHLEPASGSTPCVHIPFGVRNV
ncbi:MAG: 5'-nucleotidase [Sphingomonas hengshuiensis]|uniref:5'-nucleotidase n=1 Tax=Sphingomonas hengshuiensis TaxID=1609977 RepID=A0A2W5B149_9SPHN|nr:MAG: 5'-nucleotidase [Sphingomonas hengshuiensis]